MPKTVEYCTNGIREVYSKKGCNSCWNCKHLVNMVDPSHYMCRSRALSSHHDRNFPYDNTKCEEYKDGENS